MAKFLEFQGKQYFKKSGIPIPEGSVAKTPEEAVEVARGIGRPVVVKAQVLVGGRGKAGGIKLAATPEEAGRMAEQILGMTIKGLVVKQVLVEEQLDVAQEFYAGLIINSAQDVRGPVLMFSPEGGMDIESVPADKIATLNVDVIKGLMIHDTLDMVVSMGIKGSALRPLAEVVLKLYNAFRKNDCRTLEINPLVLTRDGKVLAADCRMEADDQALFRHPEFGIKIGREFLKEPTDFELMGWSFEADDFRGTSYLAEMASPEELHEWRLRRLSRDRRRCGDAWYGCPQQGRSESCRLCRYQRQSNRLQGVPCCQADHVATEHRGLFPRRLHDGQSGTVAPRPRSRQGPAGRAAETTRLSRGSAALW